MTKKVIVGLSGGVDSSVAALLLKEQGYDVHGMMLRLWSEPGCEDENKCCSPEGEMIAREVASILDIPFRMVDSTEIFKANIVDDFISSYEAGLTPNPCVRCNRLVRWGFFLDYALEQGADYLATGHYARLVVDSEMGNTKLLKGVDPGKDQAYVLSLLNQHQLSKTLLPLGELTKDEVRKIAAKHNLPSASISDSQDLCFLGERTYAEFLENYIPASFVSGPIKKSDGETIGEHNGLIHYTLGQRKGIRVAAPEPYYVISKDIENNTLIVGMKDELGNQRFVVNEFNWVQTNPDRPFNCDVKIRYKTKSVPAVVQPIDEDSARIELEQPVSAITPGQVAVCYDFDEVIGAGIIGSLLI